MKFSDARKVHTNIQLFVHIELSRSLRSLKLVFNFLVDPSELRNSPPWRLLLSPGNRIPSRLAISSSGLNPLAHRPRPVAELVSQLHVKR
jgi:hypothetical protein